MRRLLFSNKETTASDADPKNFGLFNIFSTASNVLLQYSSSSPAESNGTVSMMVSSLEILLRFSRRPSVDSLWRTHSASLQRKRAQWSSLLVTNEDFGEVVLLIEKDFAKGTMLISE